MTTQYASATDLARLGLSTRALTGVSSDVIEDALVAASSVADGYMGSRYGDALPLTTWPESLRSAVACIAAMSVLGTIGFNPEDGAHVIVMRRYEMAIQWLRDVSTGKVTLPVSDTAPARVASPRVRSRACE